jgi:transmembrane sensor
MTGFPEDEATVPKDAAAWFVRLQSESARESDWTAFEVWLQADPANQAAFDAVERLWVDLDQAEVDAGGATPLTTNVLPFSRRSKRAPWGFWAATGGVAAALVLGMVAPGFFKPSQMPPPRTVTTAKGERKSLTLKDGTRIELSSATTLDYRVDRGARWVRLDQGEAVFNVRHDPGRPFDVVTGDRRITDIGTIFDVARLDRAVRVTVQAGAVDVQSASAKPGPPTRVSAGLQLIHVDGAAGSSVKPVDVDAALAWRSGRLVYEDAPLETVVSDLNRYFPTPIRVKDRKTAELRFSGVLVLDSEGAVVDRLQAYMPVAAVRTNGAIWIGGRR